jgi:D-sedoheptulose 7-phosphate isomerase
MVNMDFIDSELDAHISILKKTVNECSSEIGIITELLINCFQNHHKLLVCGNGGSAADAQHIAGEFVNRFRFDRPGLPAIALTTDTSVLTSIGNDSSYDFIFSRQVETLASVGDVLVGISTSGTSRNILNALEAAKKKGIFTVGFTGEKGRQGMADLCDQCLIIPSMDTPRIQEAHLFIWHYICGRVEKHIFGGENRTL